MSEVLTDAEKETLLRAVMERVYRALETGCDCALHRPSPEEQTARIDAAIEAVNSEIRANGGKP